MRNLVPWDQMAKLLYTHLSDWHGRTSLNLRIILGAPLVKHIEGLSIENRLLGLQQLHARPIKRGKGGGKDTELGPRINGSLSEGIVRVNQIGPEWTAKAANHRFCNS